MSVCFLLHIVIIIIFIVVCPFSLTSQLSWPHWYCTLLVLVVLSQQNISAPVNHSCPRSLCLDSFSPYICSSLVISLVTKICAIPMLMIHNFISVPNPPPCSPHNQLSVVCMKSKYISTNLLKLSSNKTEFFVLASKPYSSRLVIYT